MNSKKAKKLRQLVRHLQDRGIVRNDVAWAAGHYTCTSPKIKSKPVEEVGGLDEMVDSVKSVPEKPPGLSYRLNDNSGRKLYQQMKKA